MPLVVAATRSLFPKEAPRPARRRVRGPSLLGQVFAIGCALVPLAAMVQAVALTA